MSGVLIGIAIGAALGLIFYWILIGVACKRASNCKDKRGLMVATIVTAFMCPPAAIVLSIVILCTTCEMGAGLHDVVGR